MNRIIKFRVLFDTPTLEDKHNKKEFTPYWYYFGIGESYDPFRVSNKDTESQYTGRKDKNNNLIFEDDIVKWVGPDGVVDQGVIEWDEEYAGFGITGDHCLDWSHGIERIGNSWENPELIGL